MTSGRAGPGALVLPARTRVATRRRAGPLPAARAAAGLPRADDGHDHPRLLRVRVPVGPEEAASAAMNHYVLPRGYEEREQSARCGPIAIARLVEEMRALGCAGSRPAGEALRRRLDPGGAAARGPHRGAQRADRARGAGERGDPDRGRGRGRGPRAQDRLPHGERHRAGQEALDRWRSIGRRSSRCSWRRPRRTSPRSRALCSRSRRAARRRGAGDRLSRRPHAEGQLHLARLHGPGPDRARGRGPARRPAARGPRGVRRGRDAAAGRPRSDAGDARGRGRGPLEPRPEHEAIIAEIARLASGAASDRPPARCAGGRGGSSAPRSGPRRCASDSTSSTSC